MELAWGKNSRDDLLLLRLKMVAIRVLTLCIMTLGCVGCGTKRADVAPASLVRAQTIELNKVVYEFSLRERKTPDGTVYEVLRTPLDAFGRSKGEGDVLYRRLPPPPDIAKSNFAPFEIVDFWVDQQTATAYVLDAMELNFTLLSFDANRKALPDDPADQSAPAERRVVYASVQHDVLLWGTTAAKLQAQDRVLHVFLDTAPWQKKQERRFSFSLDDGRELEHSPEPSRKLDD